VRKRLGTGDRGLVINNTRRRVENRNPAAFLRMQ